MRYYEREGDRLLAYDFYERVLAAANAAALHPSRHHVGPRGLRRAKLKRFPYHLLFKEGAGQITVFVVRHNTRHPNFGLTRMPS
jgi:hypothetical protein